MSKPNSLGFDCAAQMEMEHNAWMRMCDCLKVLTGESVNEQKYRPLISFMRIWGEELAVLRREQGEKGIEWGRNVRKEEATELAKLEIVASFSD